MADGMFVADTDDRAEQMLADPKGYFERARARARAQVRREIADGLSERRLQVHAA
jgi:hypothetical protein